MVMINKGVFQTKASGARAQKAVKCLYRHIPFSYERNTYQFFFHQNQGMVKELIVLSNKNKTNFLGKEIFFKKYFCLVWKILLLVKKYYRIENKKKYQ